MNLHHQDNTTKVIHGDCIETMKAMPPESVDAIVCDPPYGLSNTTPAQVADTITKWAGGDRDHVPTGRGFMGKSWDAFVPPPAVWDECLRVLKPGGHMVVFAGSRTHDLMGLSIRLAGFEMRDSLAWLYGSGFPKSHDVSKGIDKEANRRDLFEPIRTHIREWRDRNGMSNADLNAAVGSKTNGCGMARHWTSAEGGQHAIPSKGQWVNLKRALGWPDCELDELYASVKDGAERPVIGTHKIGLVTGSAGVGGGGAGGSITAPATPEAEQWDGWGTALKPAFEPIVLARKPFPGTVAKNVLEHGTGAINVDACRINGTSGRWPANVLLDHNAATWVDEQSGHQKDGVAVNRNRDPEADKQAAIYGPSAPADRPDITYGGGGGASRFFYVAKAPKRERPNVDGVQHPTVKPLAIMEWLIRLVTPPGGTVLDPFAGSGTTLEAARKAGFSSIGIEAEETYLPLIDQRLQRSNTNPTELEGAGG